MALTKEDLQAIRTLIREENADMRADIGVMKTDVTGLKTDVAGLKTDVAELKTDVAGLKTDVTGLKTDVAGLKTDVAGLKTDVTGLKTDVAGLKTDVTDIKEMQEVHTKAIMNLENSVMHELKLLTELLPNAVARNETLTRLEVVVSSHGDRLSALELKANNG